jgi:hypothetical protein
MLNAELSWFVSNSPTTKPKSQKELFASHASRTFDRKLVNAGKWQPWLVGLTGRASSSSRTPPHYDTRRLKP